MKQPFHRLSQAAHLGILILLVQGCATETRTTSSSNHSSVSVKPLAVWAYIDKREERKQGIPPESKWNFNQIWQRVESQPPTYIPKGYPRDLPRTESQGQWFVDQRDGKRLFVPVTRVGIYEPSILRAEATKITNWTYR